MTTNTNAAGANRQFFTKMLGGAVFGGGCTALFLYLVGDQRLDFTDAASMVTVVAGLSYLLIGVLVGLGVLAPATGARFLNVQDADEIVEERPKLVPSAIACVLIGIFLLSLQFAPSLGGGNAALVVAGACLAGVVAITLMASARGDEMVRQIGVEASSFTLHAGLVIMAVWAALAHLGYAPWVDPLGLISGAALLHLFAIFAISGQKGLMRPR